MSGFEAVWRKVKQIFEVISALQHAVGQIFIIIRRNFHSTDNSSELGRFDKYIWELESVFDKWMYLLKHIHEMVEIPQEFADPLFKRLFLLAEIDKFTAAEKKQYLKSLENMGDYRNMINSAAEEAEKRGHAAGLAEAARRMLAAGMSLKSVSEILQVPESELQKQL